MELTSTTLKGQIDSNSTTEDIALFLAENPFSQTQISVITKLFAEANANGFTVTIKQNTLKRI